MTFADDDADVEEDEVLFSLCNAHIAHYACEQNWWHSAPAFE